MLKPLTSTEILRSIRDLDPDPVLATADEVEQLREMAGYERLADAAFAPPCQSCADLADALEASDRLASVLRTEAGDYRQQRDLVVSRFDRLRWALFVAVVVIAGLVMALVGRG